MNVPIGEVVHLDAITSSPTTGGVSDADSAPTFSVYEEDTDTALDNCSAVVMTKRTGLTGNYRGSFTASLANGFEAGKWYSAIGSATVGGVTGKAILKHFRCSPAENVAGVPIADAGYVAGTAQTAGDIIPAISAIGSGTGAALNFGPDTDSGTTDPLNGVTKVGTTGDVYTDVNFNNGNYEVITHATNNIDWVYKYSVGSGRSAATVTFNGYLAATAPATSKSIGVFAYNWVTPGWDSIGTIIGQAGTVDITQDFTLLARNTGTGANAGIVYIRFTATAQTGAVLNVDQLTISAQNLGQTVGYADGAIWIGGANANTTPYVDGTADNPCTYAAALTLATTLGLTRFRVRNGTTVTLTATAANKSFIGASWTLALGGQAIDGAYFEGCDVSGTGTNTAQAEFTNCHINAGTTVGPSMFLHTGFAGSVGSPFVAGSAGEFLFVDCFSEVAGSGTPYFTLSGASGCNFRRWSGGSNITLNNASATLTMEVLVGGKQTIALAGASVEIRGICREIALTGIATTTTAQIDCVTGPISLAGADGTVNIYGVTGTVTDSRTGTPLGTRATSLNTVNLATPTNITSATGITVSTNSDKTGYSLTQAFPTNFAALAITVGGAVTAGTVSDKTGYSLTQAFPANFAALGINVSGHVDRVTLADTVTTLTGHTPQTGDSYAKVNDGTIGLAAIKGYVDDIGVAGAGLTALGDARLANLDAAISSRLAAAGYTAPDNANIGNIHTIVSSGLHGNAALKALIDTIDNLIDTEVDAIKQKTDQFVFTTPNKVDASASVSLTQEDIDAIATGVSAGINLPDVTIEVPRQ